MSGRSRSLSARGMLTVYGSGRTLRSARAALTRAQRDTQEAFKRYKTCLDVESQALQQVNTAEERRDALSMSHLSLVLGPI